MKNKWFRKMAVSSLALSALGTGLVIPVTQRLTPVFAESDSPTLNYSATNGVVNMGSGTASIVIHGNEGQPMIGKKFVVYQLFNAENAEGDESINYTYTNSYKAELQKVVGERLNKPAGEVTEYDVIDYIQSINRNQIEGVHANQKEEGRYSDFRYFVEELRDELRNGEMVTVNSTDSNGDITLTGLDYGYYLIDEVTENEGTDSASSLCMVNTANPEAEIQIKSDYPSVIKKIEEDDNDIGWNDIGDFEIGQTVPYKYETRVPNMNGYHSYYFAFHDNMNEALTFHPESVDIQISNGSKTYTLKTSEFNILEDLENVTFKIEISDLKAIVDREFPEGMNAEHENIYNQGITVRYNATLNDLASKDTGKPGFENSVKLEFSNDPDSDGVGKTGETPWDTVVAFTYRLNVNKINNHNKALRNAKFRLYSDPECKNEVFVKQTDDGYNVINRDMLGGTDHTGGITPTEAVEMVSNEEGNFVIFGLDQGVYYLKETDSPAGYRELLDPIELTVAPKFTDERNMYVAGEGATDKILKELVATAHTKEFYNGAYSENTVDLETNVDDGSMNITVVNQVGKKLPITGSNVAIIMLGSGLAIMAGSLAFWKKKKKAGNTNESMDQE